MTDASESIDLAELERLARSATPGPWDIETARVDTEMGTYTARGIRDVAPLMEFSDSAPAHTALEDLTHENAQFIAATDPTTVLALVARVRDAEARIEKVREWCSDPCTEGCCEHCSGKNAAYEQVLDILVEEGEQ